MQARKDDSFFLMRLRLTQELSKLKSIKISLIESKTKKGQPINQG